MKFLFVCESRYPTPKAYGVTIGRTAESARRLGHDVTILTPNFKGIDSYGNYALPAISKIYNFIDSLAKHSFALFTFQIISMFVSTLVTIKRTNPEIVWCRHPINSLLALLCKKSNIVIEIHHTPNRLNMFILNLLSWNSNLFVFTLSNHHVREFKNKGMRDKPSILPMAAPSNFKILEKEWPKSDSSLKIAYLGRFQSSGMSNGIAEFIEELKVLFAMDLNIEVTFVGISQIELEETSGNYRPEDFIRRISLIENIEHNEIDKFLENIDIGVIPYPRSKYNNFRFPIKAIEYARMRCLIVASDLEIHREIVGENNAFFYIQEKKGDFSKIIDNITSDKRMAYRKVENAFEWSLQLNYEKRVLSVISSVRNPM